MLSYTHSKTVPGTLALLVAVLSALCIGTIRPAEGQTVSPALAIRMNTLIVPGCVLNIVVEGEEEISRDYTVDAKGCVTFHIADSAGVTHERWSVAVSGKTADDARGTVTESLMTYFKHPDVHLKIVKIPGIAVEILGEVTRQTTVLLPFGSRLSDLFSAVLTKPRADLENIMIRRPMPEGSSSAVQTLLVDFSTGVNGVDSDDPKLQEGDKVYVRKLPDTTLPAELQIVRIIGEFKNEINASDKGVVQREDGVSLPIAPGMTLKAALERVGGFRDTADRSRIYLGRMDGTARTIDGDRALAEAPDQNVVLKAGDLVIIPKRDRSQAYAVLGEVGAPKTFEMRPGEKVTVMQALAKAGDFSKKADHHRAVLSRGYLLDPAKARAIPFDPELVKRGEQPNMMMEPGDALIVEQRPHRPTIWQQLLPFALHFLPF